MDALQNLSNQNSQTDVDTKKDSESQDDWRHQAWIDYRALNGTIIDFDEETKQETVRKLKMDKLAEMLNVSRQQLYNWEKTIPNFWEKVRIRKSELSSQRRLSFMEDKFYIHAMTWKNPMISLKWLEQNNPDWRDPRYKLEHEIGDNMATLLRQMEIDKQPEHKNVIEAKVTTHDTQTT